jgi:hypothetical protein
MSGNSVSASCCSCSRPVVAHFPRSFRCGDRVRLQDYFCRADEAAGTPLDDPKEKLTVLTLCSASISTEHNKDDSQHGTEDP